MSVDAFDDDRFEEDLFKWLSDHATIILKAPLIAAMIGFSATMLGGSLFKGIVVGVAALILSAFGVWRRFLEPLSFWAFLISVTVWCEPQIVPKLLSIFK